MSNGRVSIIQTVFAAALGLALGIRQADAADIKVVSGPAMARVLTDLAPRIEELTHRTLVIDVASVNAVTRRLSEGAPFDVAVVYEPAAIALIESSQIVAGGLS